MGHGINTQWHIALHHAREHRILVALLESNATIGDLVGAFGAVRKSPIELHGCIEWKTCFG